MNDGDDDAEDRRFASTSTQSAVAQEANHNNNGYLERLNPPGPQRLQILQIHIYMNNKG